MIKLKDIDRAGSIDDEYDFSSYRDGVLKSTIEKYGKGNVLDAVFNMDAKISSLLVENEVLEELVDWAALEEASMEDALEEDTQEEEDES
tara:strand:+ start:3862 stop:4131 length:270 start_codon:yes stop_codon:yes gene_type:complete